MSGSPRVGFTLDRPLSSSFLLLVALAALLAWPVSPPASAEALVEVWRSFPSGAQSVSVNPADGSGWVAASGGVMHLSAAGEILLQPYERGVSVLSVSVNSEDGSCWAACWAWGEGYVVHLSATGAELWRSTNLIRPTLVAVNRDDGSCWIAENPTDGSEAAAIRVAADGTELARTEGFDVVSALAVNYAEGTCWVSDVPSGTVYRLAETGRELWSGTGFGSPVSLSVDPDDGSCWVADSLSQRLIRLASSGAELWRSDELWEFGAICVNEADSSCYVTTSNNRLLVFSADGTLLGNAGSFGHASISVSPTDGACWVASGAVILVSPELQEVWRREAYAGVVDVAADESDGSCLVALRDQDAVLRVASDGSEVWRKLMIHPYSLSLNRDDGSWWVGGPGHVTHYDRDCGHLGSASANVPLALSIDHKNGSCWVACAGTDEVLHVDPSGQELWRQDGWAGVSAVSANANDGSCWIGRELGESGGDGSVSHVSEAGELLCSLEDYGEYIAMAVDEANDTCWVSYDSQGSFVNLDSDGTELARVTDILGGCDDLEVDASDGSFWACGRPSSIVHAAADGTLLSSIRGFDSPDSLSLDGTRRCLWVADTGNRQLVKLQILPFSDIDGDGWASRSIAACVASGIVSGYPDGDYHPELPVTRDQMAVYISRGLAGGDVCVPTGPAEATFADVDTDHWAYDYVEYAAAQSVVAGYDDGSYHPEYEVTRDQMAVYVARAMVAPTGEAALADYVPSDPRSFPDVATDFWSYRHIEYCVEQGVVNGYDDGYYHPETVVTRDQMAVYVARAFGLRP